MRPLIFLLVIFPFLLSGESIKGSVSFVHNCRGDTNIKFNETKNIYSNYKYSVSFDGPDQWQTDFGLSKHTIFRTYEADSGITFSINVIKAEEFLPGLRFPPNTNMWDVYQGGKGSLDSLFRISVKKAYNIDELTLEREKSYLSNHVALKTSTRHIKRELQYDYEVTLVHFQVWRKRRVYTFTLSIPSVFYRDKAVYYDYLLFQKVNFLLEYDR